MDITVYLPEELGRWAKDEKLNLSAMLRAAVAAERELRGAQVETLSQASEWELNVQTDSGRRYKARLHGARIADPRDSDATVYLGHDGAVYVHQHDGGPLERLDDSDSIGDRLRELLSEDEYLDATEALGIEAVIDVGMKR